MHPLRSMTDDEFAAWMAEATTGYAADKVRAGQWQEEGGLARAREEFAELLPQGRHTEGHRHFTIQDATGAAVGAIWIARAERPDGPVAYLYDLVVRPEHQRRGHAERAMRALEAEVRHMGLVGVALHVFGHNQAAQALYRKLGFAPTNINMFKAL